MTAKTTTTTRIESLTRLNNSINGNPRFRVFFADGTDAVTSSDHSFCYSITNPEMRGDVVVTYTRAGRIEDIRPATYRPATEDETAAWLAGHLSIEGAQESEHGLMILA